MERWVIKPQTSPIIIRNCSKCGPGSKFVCGGNFRINANGKNIDVWLIYKCNNCSTTWNMEIVSRVKPQQIGPSLYQSFAKNDFEVAMQYAFNQNVMNRNKAVVSYEDVSYLVEKSSLDDPNYALEIVSQYDFGLRLDKLLGDELGLSRTKIKELFEKGRIISDEMKLTTKSKIKDSIKIKEIIRDENKKSNLDESGK